MTPLRTARPRYLAIGLVALLLVAGGVLAASSLLAPGDAGPREVSPAGVMEAPDPLVIGGREAGALLVKYRRSRPPGWAAAVTPLAPGTLESLPAVEALDLGLQGGTLVSPDGRLMAVSSWEAHPGESFSIAPSGRVTLVDVAWQTLGVIESAPGVTPAGWSEDGLVLYGARNYCATPATEGACPGGWARELWAFDTRALTARRVVEVDFESGRWHFHGDRAVGLGARTDTCCGIDPEGDPFVTVVNVAAGEIEAEIALPGMLIGQPGHWLGDTTMFASYHPATALSPDGSTLYVVDPVEDEVRVVDLRALAVTETIGFGEERSGLAGFGDWLVSQLVGTAEAKGNPTHSRQAAVTADGRYLVVSGTEAQEEEPAMNGEPRWTDRPAGLAVIDLMNRETVLREDHVGTFVVSLDGRWVLGTGSYYDEALLDENENGGLVAFGLKLVDLASLEVAGHLWRGEEASVLALSPDGRYAYVRTDGPGLDALQRVAPPKPPCGADCWLVHVLEVEGGEVVATRPLGEIEGVLSLVAQP